MQFWSGFDLRDWILANDPALSRLRLGLRVTLIVTISFLLLFALQTLGLVIPEAGFALAIILSIQGGISVKEKQPSAQLLTRLLSCVASLAVMALAAALADHRVLSDLVFLVIIFLATAIRSYGVRGFAIGMFAFFSYLMGSYFHPPLVELPLVALGPLVTALVGQAIGVYLLPDVWQSDLTRAVESVQGRINQILFKLGSLSADGHISEADKQELNHLENRLKEVVLMAESFLPRPAENKSGQASPALELAIKLFDVHLAAESALVLSMEVLPDFALVHAIIENDQASLREKEAAVQNLEAGGKRETTRALLWLADAKAALESAMREGVRTGFGAYQQKGAAAGTWKFDFSWSSPHLRSAIQVTLATGLAMAAGLSMSQDRWYWAVLTAFLVFNNTNSRGDTATRALQRSLGTLFGVVIGLGLATLIGTDLWLALPLSVLGIFLAFYFLQISFAALTFFVSIVLCLAYGMLGILTVDLLAVRLTETIVGSAAGTLVAFLVFPAKTRTVVDASLGKWFQALDRLLSEAAVGKKTYELIPLSQALDAAYQSVTIAARPLGSQWSVVTKPGVIRQTLAVFLATTYWARIFASNYDAIKFKDDAEVQELLANTRARLKEVAARKSDCFFVDRKAPSLSSGHLPLYRNGSRLGLQMMSSMLSRLYPSNKT